VDSYALASGVIYGPVRSRRLGTSLGINILPFNVKVCSFNCNYCQCGWTYDLTDPEVLAKYTWPSGAEVARDLEAWLKANPAVKLDCMTLSGNGEPTLHPDFDGVVSEILEVRDRSAAGVTVDILTNGANLSNPRVVGGCNLLDERYVKLDAGSESMFLEMASPTIEIGIWDIIQGAKRLRDCVIQSMFTRGRRDNTGPQDVEQWINAVAQVNPKGVQVYTVSRSPADNRIHEAPRERLEEIAGRLTAETGIPAAVY
jgi:wyosine [tRNA(Phe)-imidazoG37] synthetase (radical SAM superfamily)